MMSDSQSLIVVGAGVLGLTCALRLQQSGYHIYVVASHFPGELDINYASPWAGSHFRAVPVTNAVEAFERELTDETTAFLKKVSSNPDSSVQFCEAIEYFDHPDLSYTDLKPEHRYSELNNFRVLSQGDLPSGTKWGVSYEGWILNSPVYLLWLRRQIEIERNAQFIRGNIDNISDAINIVQANNDNADMAFRAIVNATGTGLSDPASFISRGQFLRISNTYHRTISHHHADGSSTVVVPRPNGGGTLIGGSKEPENYDEAPNDEITKWIVGKVSQLCPDLLANGASDGKPGLHVTNVNIGRRPMRKGGIRIQREDFFLNGVDNRENHTEASTRLPFVVHCYGAGGSGYKISWGAAGRVLKLVQEA